jgi:hypothetical protein
MAEEDTTPESVQKWAGAPSASNGLGGSSSKTDDKAYDPSKKPTPFTEVGASGLAQYGGFVREEFLPALQGDNARKVFREMYDNDPIVGAVVFAIQMLIRKVEWRVEPAEAATVEEIVEERFQERQAAANEQKQAQQQRLLDQQSGLAGNSSSPRSAGPGGKPGVPQPPQMGRSGLASPSSSPLGIHEPITPKPAVGASQGGGGSPYTPPTQPGANSPLPTNTNQPSLTGVPDTDGTSPVNNPGTNPGGGPAQAAALAGNFGTGSEPQADDKNKGGTNVQKGIVSRLFGGVGFRKAGGSSGGGGGSIGGIDGDGVTDTPIDPETGEPMEFAIGSGPTDLTPAARKAEELAVFVETCFHDMADSWADSLAQIVTMIVFGFAYHEVIYKKRNGPNPDFPSQGSKFADGRIGWQNLAGRAQETLFRWEFDDNGNILGFWQLAPPKFQLRYIPLSKALLFRTTAYKNNPEGRSVFRSAYRPWFFKKRIEEYEAIGVERSLAGMPIAYVPYQMMTAGATPEERATVEEIKKIVRNVRRNEQGGIVFPMAYEPDTNNKLYDFALLGGEGERTVDTDKIITRYEQRIAMTALADVLLLGHDSVGARSLGETKVDLFTAALEGWLDGIADTINTGGIPRLMQINGEDPAMCPKLTHGKMATISLEELGAIITALAGAGADLFPDTQLEDAVREKAGLPAKAASQDL